MGNGFIVVLTSHFCASNIVFCVFAVHQTQQKKAGRSLWVQQGVWACSLPVCSIYTYRRASSLQRRDSRSDGMTSDISAAGSEGSRRTMLIKLHGDRDFELLKMSWRTFLLLRQIVKYKLDGNCETEFSLVISAVSNRSSATLQRQGQHTD